MKGWNRFFTSVEQSKDCMTDWLSNSRPSLKMTTRRPLLTVSTPMDLTLIRIILASCTFSRNDSKIYLYRKMKPKLWYQHHNQLNKTSLTSNRYLVWFQNNYWIGKQCSIHSGDGFHIQHHLMHLELLEQERRIKSFFHHFQYAELFSR